MDSDLGFDEETRECVHLLLENYWLPFEGETRDAYFSIKRNEVTLKEFFEEHFRMRLVVNRYMARLEKIPLKAESWMGIPYFKERIDYVHFCCLMAFLEAKEPGYQFLLSSLLLEVRVHSGSDWKSAAERRSFARVLRFAQEMGMIIVEEGDVLQFGHEEGLQVLFTITSLARNFLRKIDRDIRSTSNLEDFLVEDRMRFGEHHRLMRRLVLYPVAHRHEMTDGEAFLIENNSKAIKEIFESFTNFELETYSECALLGRNMSSRGADTYPNGKGISFAMLNFSQHFIGKVIETGEAELDGLNRCYIPKALFDRWVFETKALYGQGWSKEIQLLGNRALSDTMLNFLKEWRLGDETEDSVVLYAPISRAVGYFENEEDQEWIEDAM